MAKIRYYYDTETCKYERIRVSTWDVLLNALGFVFVSSIIAAFALFLFWKYFDSPKEIALKKENEELKYYNQLHESDVEQLKEMLHALEVRDDNIYRVIFGADPIPATVRNAGVGGSYRYKELLDQGLSQEKLILSTQQKIDQLKKQMYVQTKSYDEIVQLAKQKEKMWASIPAIQPISNKKLTSLVSGFGMRIHPIYKVKKMHTGIDFAANQGTPVYATGDGKVRLTEMKYDGYGINVEISHGFGYISKYAHLRKFIVREGQRVKRGEIIGYVGSTGTSTAPHLHYEIIYNGQKVNPVHYFFNDLKSDEYEKILELASQENQSLS